MDGLGTVKVPIFARIDGKEIEIGILDLPIGLRSMSSDDTKIHVHVAADPAEVGRQISASLHRATCGGGN